MTYLRNYEYVISEGEGTMVDYGVAWDHVPTPSPGQTVMAAQCDADCETGQ